MGHTAWVTRREIKKLEVGAQRALRLLVFYIFVPDCHKLQRVGHNCHPATFCLTEERQFRQEWLSSPLDPFVPPRRWRRPSMPYLQPSCPAMLYYCKPCHASPFDTRCSIFLPTMLFLQLSCHYLPYQGKPCHTLPLLAPYLQYACLSSCALLLTHKSFNIFGWLGRNWDATGGPDLWIHHFTGSSERGSQKASIQNALMNLNALKKIG